MDLFELNGGSVVELGAGMGLCGLVVAGATKISQVGTVVITDFNDEVLMHLQASVDINGFTNALVQRFDWNAKPPFVCQDAAMIIAADVLYDKGSDLLIFNTVEKCIGPGGMFLLANEARVVHDASLLKKLVIRFKCARYEVLREEQIERKRHILLVRKPSIVKTVDSVS